jgi:hypothetical protein
MNLAESLKTGGRGIISTANSTGVVNSAVYAMPHIIDEKTVAWGMTDGRTYHNIKDNPHASYLYMNPGHGFSGVRINLKLKELMDSGKLLESIRERTAEIVSPQAAERVTHVAYFIVVEIRPLI